MVFGLLFAGLGIATLSGYGVMWDCWEMYTGDRNLQFLLSWDSDYLDYTKPMPMPIYDERPDHPDFYRITMAGRHNPAIHDPWHIWPVGPLSSSITKHVFFGWLGVLDPFEAHHLAPVLWALALLVALYFFVLRYAGRWEAVIAVVALAVYPRFWAHLHFNLKDIPSTVVFSLVIFSFYRGVLKERWGWVLLSAVLWGVGLATKGNALFLPFILIPWFGALAYTRYWRERRLPPRPMRLVLFIYPVVGFAVMFLLWPFLLIEFPDHLVAHVRYLFLRAYQGSNEWHWQPLVNAIVTMPIAVLLLLPAGVWALTRKSAKQTESPQLSGLLLGLWVGIPLLRVSVPKAEDFDVIRHWLEFVPAVCILAGLGGGALLRQLGKLAEKLSVQCGSGYHAAILEKLRGRLAFAERVPWLLPLLAVLLWFTPVISWNIRNHPHQLVFYNFAIGGLHGAQELGLPEATDYWGISHRQGCRWLNANAEPGALVLANIGDQTFVYTKDLWLRRDLHFRGVYQWQPGATVDLIHHHPGAVYLIYITRKGLYTEFFRELDKRHDPAYLIKVDGGIILKILRLKDAQGNYPTRPIEAGAEPSIPQKRR